MNVRIWFTPRALLLHLVALVVVPGFVGLAWWQLHRALGGNSLSWAYTFEWPFFAGYAVFVWWKLVHDQRNRGATPPVVSAPAERPVGWALGGPAPAGPAGLPDGPAGDPAPPGAAGDPAGAVPEPVVAGSPAGSAAAAGPGDGPGPRSEEDRELAEYNEYLAALSASGRRKRW